MCVYGHAHVSEREREGQRYMEFFAFTLTKIKTFTFYVCDVSHNFFIVSEFITDVLVQNMVSGWFKIQTENIPNKRNDILQTCIPKVH